MEHSLSSAPSARLPERAHISLRQLRTGALCTALGSFVQSFGFARSVR
jgi:hypothetical protein